MSNLLKAERCGDSLVIKFTRPEIRNPLSVSVIEEINSVLDHCPSEIRALIFTGSEESFASGADLREIAEVSNDTAREFAERGQLLMSRVESVAQTTVAAINGYCFGGALDLALACEKRLASPTAKFAHPGAGLGIITGWGGTQRLPRLVGTAFANEMFFTASPINAERALRIGLVDSIRDDVVRSALELADRSEI